MMFRILFRDRTRKCWGKSSSRSRVHSSTSVLGSASRLVILFAFSEPSRLLSSLVLSEVSIKFSPAVLAHEHGTRIFRGLWPEGKKTRYMVLREVLDGLGRAKSVIWLGQTGKMEEDKSGVDRLSFYFTVLHVLQTSETVTSVLRACRQHPSIFSPDALL
ncbi:hypothetical protein J3R30DRAFT_3546482 [Lentinula aciculospora]|uniref:Uncharacterized protein n=1 Tax=Lentinula aciculospora TaxID=153920 RepID=A0A9W8ZYT2_9AGAR|nr:hypothetical protein J3R30DRAFT_3546482 [Lentinula aciculospora]